MPDGLACGTAQERVFCVSGRWCLAGAVVLGMQDQGSHAGVSGSSRTRRECARLSARISPRAWHGCDATQKSGTWRRCRCHRRRGRRLVRVLVLYVIQVLYQKPGAYGALLAVGGVNGIGPCLTRRLGMWPVLLLAGLAMAASPVRPRAHRERFMAALMLAASSPPALCST
jgi:hypothetical protein